MQPVITLCGSTKFKNEFLAAATICGEQGLVVMSLTTFTHADNVETSPETIAILEAVHMQKILMSDSIFVINKDGYIGESTLREIAFAAVMRKKIKFYEPPSKTIEDMILTIRHE